MTRRYTLGRRSQSAISHRNRTSNMTEEQRLADNQVQRIRTQEGKTEETAEARAEYLAYMQDYRRRRRQHLNGLNRQSQQLTSRNYMQEHRLNMIMWAKDNRRTYKKILEKI
jgi:hypothetical protein